ncbi:class I SAM-dependent methyltransferase [Pseudomonas sp. NPDC077382]
MRLFHGRGSHPDFGKLTVDWLLSGVLVRLFHERSEMKPDALKQMLMALVALRIWQQSSARQLLLQLRYLPDAATEMLLGDVAASGRSGRAVCVTRLISGAGRVMQCVLRDMRCAPAMRKG